MLSCRNRPEGHGNGLIHSVDILRKPVEDATEGCGVKERHGGAQDVLQHAVMDGGGGPDAADSQGEGPNADKESLEDAKARVHSQKFPPGKSHRQTKLTYCKCCHVVRDREGKVF